jgi:hypothetical protein
MVLVHTSGLWSHKEKKEKREKREERENGEERREEREGKNLCVTKTKILGPGPQKCFSFHAYSHLMQSSFEKESQI